jgi:hypothetical protein
MFKHRGVLPHVTLERKHTDHWPHDRHLTSRKTFRTAYAARVLTGRQGISAPLARGHSR